MSGERSPRNAIAMTITWWYVRRLIRKRGAAAVAGFVAGEGLSLGKRKPQRHVLRWLFVAGLAAGAGVVWWRRRQSGGGRDDWGDWQPVAPEPPVPAEPAPAPEPLRDPVAT
jgi:hypothetical protein